MSSGPRMTDGRLPAVGGRPSWVRVGCLRSFYFGARTTWPSTVLIWRMPTCCRPRPSLATGPPTAAHPSRFTCAVQRRPPHGAAAVPFGPVPPCRQLGSRGDRGHCATNVGSPFEKSSGRRTGGGQWPVSRSRMARHSSAADHGPVSPLARWCRQSRPNRRKASPSLLHGGLLPLAAGSTFARGIPHEA